MKKRKFVILAFALLGSLSCIFVLNPSSKSLESDANKEYGIALNNLTPDLGSLESNVSKGYAGDEITITATPNSSSLYCLSDLKINATEIAINSTGEYHFTLPKLNTEIVASFAKKPNDETIDGIDLTINDPTIGSASLSISDSELYSTTGTYYESDYCHVEPMPQENYALKSISNNGKTILKDKESQYTFLLEKTNALFLSFSLAVDKDFVSFEEAYKKDYSAFNFVEEIKQSKITLPQFAYSVFKLVEETKNLRVISHNEAVSQAFFVTNTQETNSEWLRNDADYFKENITSSDHVKMAERAYLSNNNVTYYRVRNDDVISETEANYSEANQQTMTFAHYFAEYSANLYTPLAYLINKSTVEDSSSLTEKDDDTYSLTLSLDTDAASNYRKYMLTTTSDADFSLARQKTLSTFASIILSISLTKDLKIKTIKIQEKYDVASVVGTVPTTGSGQVTFDYGVYPIPAIDEAVSY